MLSLVGLDPAAKRRYCWIGDDACDLSASDIPAWIATGQGLVAKEGQQFTEFLCEPLRPTTLQIVINHSVTGIKPSANPTAEDFSALSAANMPAVFRMACAYGVVSAENGPALSRAYDSGGMRLTDETMGKLERFAVLVKGMRLRLVDHLGQLILGDSMPTEAEKKV